MIITICGAPGSGKSTLGRRIAKTLNYRFISGGELRGEIARKNNMTIDELNEIGAKKDWTDKDVDDLLVKIGKEEDNYCIDSWTAHYFIPNAIKFFIKCEPDVAAERVFRDQRDDEKHQDSKEEVMKMLADRWEKSRQRFLKYYGFDINDMSQFDIIIDSTARSMDEVADEALGKIKV